MRERAFLRISFFNNPKHLCQRSIHMNNGMNEFCFDNQRIFCINEFILLLSKNMNQIQKN